MRRTNGYCSTLCRGNGRRGPGRGDRAEPGLGRRGRGPDLDHLKTEGNLHLYHVSSNCLGVVNTGDKVSLTATCEVSPAQTITSP